MARRIIDISVPLQSDIASDPPGHEPKITYVNHRQSAPAVCAFFPGLTPGRSAGRRGLGDRAHRHLHPQRHPSRRALAFRLHHGRRKARHHHRRGAARVVLPAGREARLPPVPRRLCGDRRRRRGRIETHRPRAEAARDRGGQYVGRETLRRARLRADGLRHGPGGDALSHLARRAGSPAPTPGRGTRRSCTRPRSTPRPRTPS